MNGIRSKTWQQSLEGETIGFDLSDKQGTYVVLDEAGEVRSEGKVVMTTKGLQRSFGSRKPARIAIEVGTHSPWVDRQLRRLGHEVIVANPRAIPLINRNKKKSDREDAQTLARLARLDPKLLKPVQHRAEQAQVDLAILRSRDVLVRSRTAMINHVRGAVKANGSRISKCSADAFAAKAQGQIPEMLAQAVLPLLQMIEQMTQQLKDYKAQLEKLAQERYPEIVGLRQIKGVGLLTSLGFVLVLEEWQRFRSSRSVGAFVGLTTRQYQSGESNPQLRITKSGDALLRRLLVQSAHYILGPFGPDCDLRRWGLKLAGPSKNQIRKHKAVIAVARKLACLLHFLWSTGEVYEPLYSEMQDQAVA